MIYGCTGLESATRNLLIQNDVHRHVPTCTATTRSLKAWKSLRTMWVWHHQHCHVACFARFALSFVFGTEYEGSVLLFQPDRVYDASAPVKKSSIYEAGSHLWYNLRSAPASACTIDDLGFLRSVTGYLDTNFTLLPSNKNTISLLYGTNIDCILEILSIKVIMNKFPPSSILLQLSHCYYVLCCLRCSDKKNAVLGALIKATARSRNASLCR